MNMNCRIWDASCDDYLNGSMDPALRIVFLAHAADCPRCEGILEALDMDLTMLADGAPDLTSNIVARTSGSACSRAEDALAAGLDSLVDEQRLLVQGHLEHCDGCRALAATLSWLIPQLHDMGELSPQTDLTYDVLRASSAVRARKRAGLYMRALDNIQVWWEQQIRRPQFVWEVAFVGTVLLVILFGTPISPARRAPSQALNVVQAGPAKAQAITRELVARASDGIEFLLDDLDSRKSRTGPDRADLKRHGQDVGSSILQADMKSAGAGMANMRDDIKDLWLKWRESEADSARIDRVNQENDHQ